mmetsp:Transcript_16457/g.22257  ORF Transcript_16457/g.22257 Transcript_16457/m.22257 type:complete len:130 (+) Transcript_16457:1282-1671(+)|eukprot:CAMPEP_0170477080 /NCGR_PEP_ID=MMETSP0123-20130129/18389_1 /TAXON_ID=182087 /ORGANISM="Favella ehrenbergii, Strain Fehren 1" /LENGTH=129 /DNA_ID=CAMNT_0010748549 /DNA_START=1519 /DNA_END=1908 /DNA_ORIENTATION=-
MIENEDVKERANREQLKAIINEPNLNWMTSMHAACLTGKRDIVKLLLENGADLHKLDQSNFCALHYAVVNDNIDVVVLLHEHPLYGVNVLDEQFNCREYRLMSLAILNGAYECIKKFVYWGANCNEKEP